MKKLVTLALVFTLTSNYGMACDKPVTMLRKDDKAACDGFLFTPDKELEVRLKVATYDSLSNYSKKQEEIILLQDQRLTNLQEFNRKLSDDLNRTEALSFWKSTLYFALGVLVTGAVYKNAGP